METLGEIKKITYGEQLRSACSYLSNAKDDPSDYESHDEYLKELELCYEIQEYINFLEKFNPDDILPENHKFDKYKKVKQCSITDYEPFGQEWIQDVKKWTKERLVSELRQALIEKIKLQEALYAAGNLSDPDLIKDMNAFLYGKATAKICYKTNKPCKFDCEGLCKESC